MSPSATVALRMLEALGVHTREQVRHVLALWCRPSPGLSVTDVREILARFDDGEHYHRDEPETGGPLPPHVGGYSLGRAARSETGRARPEES